MSSTAPPIDPRDADLLRTELTTNLSANVPEWVATDPVAGVDQASAALIAIAARFGEIVIERLNQAPNKNFLAFLDLVGSTRLPPQPARVPLTFTVTPSSSTDAVVPAGTQVAAAPAEGETAPVVFETERELTAVSASLQTLIAVDAERDLIADYSAFLASADAGAVKIFSGNQANEHVLYIGHESYLSFAQLAALTLTVQTSAGSPASTDVRALQWELWDGLNGVPLTSTDGTQSLSAAGQIGFANLSQFPAQTVNGVSSRWLRCRLLTPISPGATPAQGMVRAAQLPLLSSLRLSAVLNRTALVPEFAFANTQAVDVSRAFLPFGEKPKIGDVFYLGQSEALGQPGGAITLNITLVNPIPDSPGPTTVPSAELMLRWETWNGTAWTSLGDTTPTGSVVGTTLVDGSKAFTKSNTVSFTLPTALAATSVNGVSSNWIRVQIRAGNYGAEAGYVVDNTQPGGFKLVLATFSPPIVGALGLSYNVTTALVAPDAFLAFNNAQFQDLTGPLAAGNAAPFSGFESEPPTLYAAFALPPTRTTFPNRTVSLYHSVRLPPYGEKVTPLAPEFSVQTVAAGTTATHSFTLTNASTESVTCSLSTLGGVWTSSAAPAQLTLLPGLSTVVRVTVTVPAVSLTGPNAADRGFLNLRLSSDEPLHSVAFETRVGAITPRRRELGFEYWNGTGWAKLVAADGTDRLLQPGVVEFLGPADFVLSEQFGVSGYWIRALFEAGDDQPIQLQALLPNTVFATQTITLTNEVLGSSDASAGLQFETTRSPVLAGPQLEVREPAQTSTQAVAVVAAPATTTALVSSDVWVPWIEVTDFHGSGAQDRHFVLDHISGQVLFGDGVQGRIPPRGVGNVRMARYQTGGGASGNRAAGTIVQLKTTIPYVEKVSNFEAATGGFDAESDDSLLERAPLALRHGGRAVALDDYEDLARAASPEVARAKTVPLRRLQDDPLSNTRTPGAVSVVIVPQSAEVKPLPSTGLMTLVEDYLRTFCTPTATIAVVGPLYVRVDVTTEIALVTLEGASEVEAAVQAELGSFLHPLTGGRDGAGWDFGRQPYLSDLYAVISDVPGVDHIRQLNINQVEEPTGALLTERFLVYSGQHQITLTFVGAE
jgi:hypothetical protein